MMLSLKKLTSAAAAPAILHHSRRLVRPNFITNDKLVGSFIPSKNPSQWTSNRFLDIYQLANKAAIEKERARISDEMSRGYFADFGEMKKHGGKIAMANKIIIPAMAATKFPALEVNFSDGSSLKLPITSSGNGSSADKLDVPKASLLCLSFRGSSQAMINSWSKPFLDEFCSSKETQLFEVSLIESWLLRRNPIKKLLLRIMKKPSPDDKKNVLQRQIVYSFGDHYYFRKELNILNLLTGYVFLLDKFGRIRWQGFGSATPEEVSSLLACTALLLEEA
ncbi:uncharacterized protein [Coffea arabica]|uniref:Mitochondrial ATPase complex subunit ATP10-like isoform X1 n=2 Tax=Coffea arabica TaxID=13443 RepID=A0A6P6X895_COFAR|nr:mitochondrial ATPase complex subunit ATP10-like isoform X1 [Coffea arabica]XP_027123574.1 mitochondrial ATPase complex subunit ATP10-like isoform X1 [Coffea arabica]